MEDQEEKPTVHVVKSRPGTFGLGTKLNSQIDSIRKDDEDAGQQKKTTSKSTLEKLLLEEEKRQLSMARESTGSVIYDYDEAMTVPYSVEIHENESAESTVTEKFSQNDVGGEESREQESHMTSETTVDVTQSVAEQISDDGNQFSYTSDSYTLEVSNEYVEQAEYVQGDQSEEAAAAIGSSDDELINSKLSETKNSLEILQIPLANSESTANEKCQETTAAVIGSCDDEFTNSNLSDTKNSLEILQISLGNSETTTNGDDQEFTQNVDHVPKKKLGNFFRKLFGGGKKKTSE